MTLDLLVFLTGLFLVPAALVGWGNRLRRLSARTRRAFGGALLGHCTAGIAAVSAGMLPPEMWTDQALLRGFLGFWSLLLFPVAGAIGGWLSSTPRG